MQDIHAEALLPSADEVRDALGSRVFVEEAGARSGAEVSGDVIKSAARDSAYRHFQGGLVGAGPEHPVAVNAMGLIFDTATRAERTFAEVAKAAHLKTQVDQCDVAVETVTGSSGLVSYWGYVQRGPALVILTVDTLDPQEVSIADLRSLVSVVTSRLASHYRDRT